MEPGSWIKRKQMLLQADQTNHRSLVTVVYSSHDNQHISEYYWSTLLENASSQEVLLKQLLDLLS